MQGQGGIFNRLDFNVINWEKVEFITFNATGNVVQINYSSGNIQKLEGISAENLKDLISTFPDININSVREQLKAGIKGLKTDVPYPYKDKNVSRIKTDIPEG